MIARVLAAFSFVFVGGAVGFSMADRLKESKKICDEIEYMFEKVSFFITYHNDDVYKICLKLRADDELKNLSFISELPESYKVGEDFRTIWSDAVKFQKNICAEEREILLHFGEIFGRSDSVSQARIIDGLKKELGTISRVRAENFTTKGRIYRSTGVLFGIMAGILII